MNTEVETYVLETPESTIGTSPDSSRQDLLGAVSEETAKGKS